VPAIPPIFHPIADVLAAIASIFQPVTDVFTTVADVFQAVTQPTLMAGVTAILQPVADVFPTIHHILTTITAILTPVTNVLDPIAGDRPTASRALREQRSRADDGEECSDGDRIQGYSWRTHNEQPPIFLMLPGW
jgi:hypothetical protein